jgi:hypothetical protein
MVDELARFEVFLRRETARQLDMRLHETLLNTAEINVAGLGAQLFSIVSEIQSDAIRAYHRQLSITETCDIPRTDVIAGTSRANEVGTPHDGPAGNLADFLSTLANDPTALNFPTPVGWIQGPIDEECPFGGLEELEEWDKVSLPSPGPSALDYGRDE